MRIREYTPDDLDALRRLHAAQSFGYPFPDLESPLFIAKLVVEDDDSRTGFSLSPFPQTLHESNPDRLKPVLLGKPFCGGREVGGSSGEAAADSVLQAGRSTQGPGNTSHSCVHDSDELRFASHGSRSTDHESRITNHDSRIVMAVLLRLTAETYLLHDPQAGTPQQRWQRLLALHEAARRSAILLGLDDVQAFLPPLIARAFGRRLARLGWTQDPWPCFSRQL